MIDETCDVSPILSKTIRNSHLYKDMEHLETAKRSFFWLPISEKTEKGFICTVEEKDTGQGTLYLLDMPSIKLELSRFPYPVLLAEQKCCDATLGLRVNFDYSGDVVSAILPAHQNKENLNFAPMSDFYPPRSASKDNIEIGGVIYDRLRVAGIFGTAFEKCYLLWKDGDDNFRGWEKTKPGILELPRAAVAGEDMLMIDFEGTGEEPIGFSRNSDAVSIATVLSYSKLRKSGFS